jgi:eukaryotic-like serine/threonine-protein kinase
VRKEAYDDNMPAGNVLAVDPAVDTEVKPGAKVTVTVSRGKAPISVPNVLGKHVEEARNVLQGMGLFVEVEERESDKPQGQVIEQNPAEGAGLEAGATIKLVVSKGPPQTPVPDVASAQNVPCRDAERTLKEAGFKVKTEGNQDAVARIQQPGPNTPAPPDTEVTIWCF